MTTAVDTSRRGAVVQRALSTMDPSDSQASLEITTRYRGLCSWGSRNMPHGSLFQFTPTGLMMPSSAWPNPSKDRVILPRQPGRFTVKDPLYGRGET